MSSEGLSTSELARRAGVNSETLRYYERRELLPEPPRTDSGYRVYPPTAVERLRFIKGAQALGFTLEEIRELLDLQVNETAGRADVRRLAREKVAHIERKIAALDAMRTALNRLIEACHGNGSTADCPILEALPHIDLDYDGSSVRDL